MAARVLILEEEPPIRELLSTVQDDGIEIVACASAEEASRLGAGSSAPLVVALVRRPFDADETRRIMRGWTERAATESADAKAMSRGIRVSVDRALARLAVARAGLERAAAHGAEGRLTPREQVVAALVAEGLTNAEIGERLVVTPGTVANHLSNILRALGCKNRVQVAVWAVERGLYRSGH